MGKTGFENGVAYSDSVTVAGGSSLSSYVENTFAPTVTLVGGTGNTTPVYSTNSGRYTRIGRIVFVDVWLTGDGGAEGAGTGVVNIALPITASASQNTGTFSVGYVRNGAYADGLPLYGQIAAGGTTIELVQRTVAGAFASVTGADQNNASRAIRMKFQYEA